MMTRNLDFENTDFDYKSARKTFSFIGLGLLVYSIVSELFSYSVYGILNTFCPSYLTTESCYWVVSVLCCYVFALGTMVLLLRNFPTAKWKSDSKFSFWQFVKIGAVCFFFLYLGNYIGIGLNSVIGVFKGNVVSNQLDEILSSTSLVYKITVVWILGPLAEEYIFRELIIGKTAIYGEKNAVVFSALMFGLFHGNFYQFFYAFLIGLVLGYVYVKTGKLKYSLFFHIFINSSGDISAELSKIADMEWLEAAAQKLNQGSDFMTVFKDITFSGALAIAVSTLSKLLFVYGIVGCIVLIVNRKKIKFSLAPLQIPQNKIKSTTYFNTGIILAVVYFLEAFAESIMM